MIKFLLYFLHLFKNNCICLYSFEKMSSPLRLIVAIANLCCQNSKGISICLGALHICRELCAYLVSGGIHLLSPPLSASGKLRLQLQLPSESPLFSHRLMGRWALGVRELLPHLHWASGAELCICNFLICKCAARNSNKHVSRHPALGSRIWNVNTWRQVSRWLIDRSSLLTAPTTFSTVLPQLFFSSSASSSSYIWMKKGPHVNLT